METREDITKVIKDMMKTSGFTHAEVAERLGIGKAYFENKIHRNSFSLLEFFKIAKICGMKIQIIKEIKELFLEI